MLGDIDSYGDESLERMRGKTVDYSIKLQVVPQKGGKVAKTSSSGYTRIT